MLRTSLFILCSTLLALTSCGPKTPPAGSATPGVASESCQKEVDADAHYFKGRTYRWTLTCEGQAERSGSFRVGVPRYSEQLGCRGSESDSLCLPCLPDVHGACAKQTAGHQATLFHQDEDAPRGGVYRRVCGSVGSPDPMLYFARQSGELIACATSSDGRDADCYDAFEDGLAGDPVQGCSFSSWAVLE